MLLFIDATDPQTVRLALVSKDSVAEHHFINNNLSERLLSEIQKFCKKQKIKLSDLTKLAVAAGPGPFSKTRTAVATANALAYGLNISVIGIKSGQKLNWPKILRQKNQLMVRPLYGKQPNITKPLDKFSQ